MGTAKRNYKLAWPWLGFQFVLNNSYRERVGEKTDLMMDFVLFYFVFVFLVIFPQENK